MIGALRRGDAPSNLKIVGLKDVSSDQEERWISAIEYLSSVEMNSFVYVERSYRSWVRAVTLARKAQPSPYSRRLGEALIEVIGATMDWLSTVRTFIDHNTFRASRSDAEILDFFKSACSRQYDARFGYRFCARLRNYAQHLGIPLHGLRIGGDFLVLDRETLLMRFSGWSSVAAELKAGPSEIPLVPVVEDAMEGLRIISDAMRERLSPDMDAALQDAREFRADFCARYPESAPVHYETPDGGWTVGDSVRMTPIPFWVIDSVEITYGLKR